MNERARVMISLACAALPETQQTRTYRNPAGTLFPPVQGTYEQLRQLKRLGRNCGRLAGTVDLTSGGAATMHR